MGEKEDSVETRVTRLETTTGILSRDIDRINNKLDLIIVQNNDMRVFFTKEDEQVKTAFNRIEKIENELRDLEIDFEKESDKNSGEITALKIKTAVAVTMITAFIQGLEYLLKAYK